MHREITTNETFTTFFYFSCIEIMQKPQFSCLSHYQFPLAWIINNVTDKNDCGSLRIFINEQKVVNISLDLVSLYGTLNLLSLIF